MLLVVVFTIKPNLIYLIRLPTIPFFMKVTLFLGTLGVRPEKSHNSSTNDFTRSKCRFLKVLKFKKSFVYSKNTFKPKRSYFLSKTVQTY